MKNIEAILLLCSLIPLQGISQDQDTSRYPHTVKLNLAAAAFKKLTLYYEYDFKNQLSVQLGGGFRFGGKIPHFLSIGDFVLSSSTGGVRGFSISPAARYHFRFCECGERTGLYAGIYGNYTKYYGDISFKYWSGNEYIDVESVGDMHEYGLGIQLGYQFTIRGRFLVDLMFMGPRTSFNRLKLEFDSQFAQEIIPKIEEEINKRLEWWGMDPISIPTDPSALIKFRYNNFRYSIGIGYIF